MNKVSEAAAILGRKGGKAGTGEAKARSREWAQAAAYARWGTLADRFWEKVKKGSPDECWLWTGSLFQPQGYGRVIVNRKRQKAHRVAWEITRGAIPEGKWVLHKCDNPPCCNPAHLYLGNVIDNARDMMERGRRKGPIGTEHPLAKLNTEKVQQIRAARGTIHKIAQRYGVADSLISRIRLRKSWKQV